MKIVGLCASPRPQGNTLRLLQRFLAECEKQGAEVELLSTLNHRVEFCQACEMCMRNGTCPLQDDYLPLLPSILKADALVLASPNYAFDISAQLKAVIDRSHAFIYYSQALRGKYGVGICVGGHWALTRSLARRCGQSVWLCGGNYVGCTWGVSRHRDKKGFVHEKRVYARTERLARKLVQEIRQGKKHPIQVWLREILLVSHLRRMFSRRRNEYPYVAGRLLG